MEHNRVSPLLPSALDSAASSHCSPTTLNLPLPFLSVLAAKKAGKADLPWRTTLEMAWLWKAGTVAISTLGGKRRKIEDKSEAIERGEVRGRARRTGAWKNQNQVRSGERIGPLEQTSLER